MSKIIFCNTAWMDYYQGVFNDAMKGGGKHIEEQGWGNEMFNFRPYKGKYYGYVRVSKDRQINLNRLGANSNQDELAGVTVVWTAKHPETGGTHIIGWYKDAVVFRNYQNPTSGLRRVWNNHDIGYCMIANQRGSKLLSLDERVVKVPRGSLGMGQTNIWYGDNNPQFVSKVIDYVNTGVFKSVKKLTFKKGIPRQKDPLKRMEVEVAAIKYVTKHYKRLGYEVSSVERDNVGWDLNAVIDSISLKLEVKGLSGMEIYTELTPNELKNLKDDQRNYRLCIVTNSLVTPELRIFSFSRDFDKWACEDGTKLKFEEYTGAKILVE